LLPSSFFLLPSRLNASVQEDYSAAGYLVLSGDIAEIFADGGHSLTTIA
jgi:hypothetical protein